MSIRRIALPLALFVAGCTTSRDIKDIEWNHSGELDEYSAVVVVESEAGQGADLIAEVRTAVVARLTDAGVFRDLTENAPQSDVILRLTITETIEVSGRAQFLYGAYAAGGNEIHGRAVLEDRLTGNVLATCVISGEAASSWMAGPTAMSDAIKELANGVIDFLTKTGRGAVEQPS